MRRLEDVANELRGLDEDALRRIAGLPVAPPPEPEPGPAAWRTLELVPGLELRVREDAPPFLHRLAESIAGRWPI